MAHLHRIAREHDPPARHVALIERQDEVAPRHVRSAARHALAPERGRAIHPHAGECLVDGATERSVSVLRRV